MLHVADASRVGRRSPSLPKRTIGQPSTSSRLCRPSTLEYEPDEWRTSREPSSSRCEGPDTSAQRCPRERLHQTALHTASPRCPSHVCGVTANQSALLGAPVGLHRGVRVAARTCDPCGRSKSPTEPFTRPSQCPVGLASLNMGGAGGVGRRSGAPPSVSWQ